MMRLRQNLLAFVATTIKYNVQGFHHPSLALVPRIGFTRPPPNHYHYYLWTSPMCSTQSCSMQSSWFRHRFMTSLSNSNGKGGGGGGGGGGGSGRGSRRNNKRRSTGSRRHSNHHGRRGRERPPPPPIPSVGEPGRGCHRSCIQRGSEVCIVKKIHQRSGEETKGTVLKLLTKSTYHPRGIKVMLIGGEVGRVVRLFNDDDDVESMMAKKGSTNEKIFKDTTSLSEYLMEKEVKKDLSRVLMAAANASAQVAHELRLLPLMLDSNNIDNNAGRINVQGEKQKGMDVRANEIFIQQLKPVVAAMVSEEEVGILYGDSSTNKYAVAFDPLDGSSNLDVSAPTGSIFGIYDCQGGASDNNPFESPSRQTLVAAGYTVYSSATELVLAGVGDGVVGFTLFDDENNTFCMSRSNMVCPKRGSYYSLNEAREPDWPDGLRKWIYDAKRGETPSGMKYSSRYVCSLTADVHRTLIKGGWAGNPRPHLRLLYEAAPLAFIMEAAGGWGSDGVGSLLDIKPLGLHDRVCCLLGSRLDIKDLEDYGNVQQTSKTYEV